MDSLIIAAARALAEGDPLGALKRVALRDDAPALALRGIAMAQLGDFDRSKVLLRRAARSFGPREELARARCVVAEAEIAFASRELNWKAKVLDTARTTLEKHGDQTNGAHARYLEIRRWVLLGQFERAERALTEIDPASLPAALRVTHALIETSIAMRRLQTKTARVALINAEHAAREANIPALLAEVESTATTLNAPVARLIARGEQRAMLLEDVEELFASNEFIVDTCRYSIREGNKIVVLANRPVLFSLARLLAEKWPSDVPRDELAARVFRLKRVDESVRVRLRVEMGRLRAAIKPMAEVNATPRGFALVPKRARNVVVLARPIEGEHGEVLAFLADGESWSSSALALALHTSQRTVQRTLDSLATEGKVQNFGYGRARRWTMTPVPGYATVLLLPASAFSH
jgi:hypothetical protein